MVAAILLLVGVTGNLITCLSTGTGFTCPHSMAAGFTDAAGWNSGLRYFTMDVNGDGRGDLVARGGDGTLITCLSTGTVFSCPYSTPTGLTDAGGWNAGDRYFVTDANGDGKGDLLARAANGTFNIFVSNGATFSFAGAASSSYSDTAGGNTHFLMDVNGDGRLDLVNRDSTSGRLTTYLFNGLRFNITGDLGATGLVDGVGYGSGVRFFPMDVNGDGKTDLVSRDTSGNLRNFISNGSSFGYGSSTSAALTDANGWNSGIRFFMMDADGDGKVDLVTRDAAGTLQTLVASGPARPLLQTITSGIGGTTALTYRTLADGTVYTNDTNAVYPVQDLQARMYVVSSVSASNGIGGNYVTRYTMRGPKTISPALACSGFCSD